MEVLATTKEVLGDHLHQKVKEVLNSSSSGDEMDDLACRVTGILLEREQELIFHMLSNDNVLQQNVNVVLQSLPKLSGKSDLIEKLKEDISEERPSQSQVQLGDEVFQAVHRIHPHLAPQITGMLLELDGYILVEMLQNPSKLSVAVNQAKSCLENGINDRKDTWSCQQQQQSNDGDCNGNHSDGSSKADDSSVSVSESMANVIYQRADSMYPQHAPKITGMLLELAPPTLEQLTSHQPSLDQAIDKACLALLKDTYH